MILSDMSDYAHAKDRIETRALSGAVGFVLSAVVLRALNAAAVIPYAQLTLNPRVFLWGVVFTAVFGLLSGAYPAWRMSWLHPVEALRGRSQ